LGIELVYALAAVFGIALFVGLVRRSAKKTLRESSRPSTRALAAKPEPEPRPPREQAPDDVRVEHKRNDQARGSGEAADTSQRRPEPDGEPGAEPEPQDDDAAAEALMQGLSRTRGGFVAKLGKLFGRKQIDENILDELEEVLLTADIGPRTAEKLFQAIKGKLSKAELSDGEAIWNEVRALSADILAVDAPPVDVNRAKPFVVLTIGVNGVGKTTTIGKLASLHTAAGKRVLLAAGDTFRAAASEQLEIWGQRAGAPVVRGKQDQDPSSVIFEAIQRAQKEDFDIVIADTAGRLHTKVDLMEELKKVRRVCNKALDGSPHETWLVVDATTGQNAIAQAQMFQEAMDITGIVLTKLDGTAKGGVILGICDELGVPVRYIGVGEQVADLREFDPGAFIHALYSLEETVAAA